MLSLPPTVRIFVSTQPADMRRSFDGLAAMTVDVIGQDPLSGHLFVFRNKRLPDFSDALLVRFDQRRRDIENVVDRLARRPCAHLLDQPRAGADHRVSPPHRPARQAAVNTHHQVA